MNQDNPEDLRLDDIILVRDFETESWVTRRFAGYVDKYVLAYPEGASSHSIPVSFPVPWNKWRRPHVTGTNPFLQAKRQKQPRQHAALRSTKYPEIWKLSVDELKTLYATTDDKYKKGAITRAINERTGIKIIRPTEAQQISRKLNYLTFVTAGYKKQLQSGMRELQSHLDGTTRLDNIYGQAVALVGRLHSLMNAIQAENTPSTAPRKRVRSKVSWNKEGAKE